MHSATCPENGTHPCADPGPPMSGLCCQTWSVASSHGCFSRGPGMPSVLPPGFPLSLTLCVFAGGRFRPGITAWWPLSHRAPRTCS